MERCDEATTNATVELGTASIDTKGAMGDIIEPMGLWHKEGVSNG